MNIEISLEAPRKQTRQASKGESGRFVRGESRPMLSRRLYLVAVITILAALLVVQVAAALTSANEVGGLPAAEELREKSTSQDLPITSPYHDNPISISGGGSLQMYR
ncbi:hypothetical protein ACFLWA_11090 [Chloroflexota bacterium]